MADEAPSYVAYIQGGESSITNGSSDGAYVITVKDIIPYLYLADGNISYLIPVEKLTNGTYPMNAAVVFSGTDDDTVSMGEVSNLSLSDGNSVLTLQVNPQKNYDGEVLKSFTYENIEVDLVKENTIKRTGIYLEMKLEVPENLISPTSEGCCVPGPKGSCYMKC